MDVQDYVVDTRRSWDQIAAWWDGTVGEAANAVVRPDVERLLEVGPGQRVLEVACGNGALARRLAELGAHVLATDFSPEFVRIAEERTRARPELADRVEHRVVDATDPGQLAALGAPGGFDAAVCVMGLMDMPTIDPLLAALGTLLRPTGSFVFALTHPCFNTTGIRRTIEEEEVDGQLVERYGVQVLRYLGLEPARATGIAGQPAPYFQFNRPLGVLFGSFFRAGFVLDAFEEVVAPPPADPALIRRLFSWARFREIPPFVVGRLRPAELRIPS
jgi:SAM-dependent methyltransferase